MIPMFLSDDSFTLKTQSTENPAKYPYSSQQTKICGILEQNKMG